MHPAACICISYNFSQKHSAVHTRDINQNELNLTLFLSISLSMRCFAWFCSAMLQCMWAIVTLGDEIWLSLFCSSPSIAVGSTRKAVERINHFVYALSASGKMLPYIIHMWSTMFGSHSPHTIIEKERGWKYMIGIWLPRTRLYTLTDITCCHEDITCLKY